MIEVDLWDDNGPEIVASAQVDPTVWAGLAAQASQLAAKQNLAVDTQSQVYNSGPTLSTIGDVQNWIASAVAGYVSGKQRAALAPKPSPGFIAGIVLAVAGAVLLVLSGRRS